VQWNRFLPKLETLERKGQRVKALEEMPEIIFFLTPAWEAFIELHNRRQIGFDMSPISIGAIKDWLDFRGYERFEMREFIFSIVCRVDDFWRKLTATKNKPKKETKKNG
jgi:hypothetical protein